MFCAVVPVEEVLQVEVQLCRNCTSEKNRSVYPMQSFPNSNRRMKTNLMDSLVTVLRVMLPDTSSHPFHVRPLLLVLQQKHLLNLEFAKQTFIQFGSINYLSIFDFVLLVLQTNIYSIWIKKIYKSDR